MCCSDYRPKPHVIMCGVSTKIHAVNKRVAGNAVVNTVCLESLLGGFTHYDQKPQIQRLEPKKRGRHVLKKIISFVFFLFF